MDSKRSRQDSGGGRSSEDKQHKKKKRKKEVKVNYSSPNWRTSSSESEYEGICHPTQVYVKNLPDDISKDELKHELRKFFKVKLKQVHVFDVGEEKHSIIACATVSKAKEALKLCGRKLLGKAIYAKPNGNTRDILRVSGFSNQLRVKNVRKLIRENIESRGNIIHIFVPENKETGCCLGFGYVYIDKGVKETLYESFEVDGVKYDVTKATPKSCFECEMVGKNTFLNKGSDEDKKTALKRVLLPIKTNLPTSMNIETPFSWNEKRPDITAEPYKQETNDCWAIALKRGYTAMRKLSGIPGQDLTVDDLLDGVDAAHQASGLGIDRIRNASSFMENYVKEMKVHRRPRGDDASDFEGFESFIKELLSIAPVVVTVECLPGFKSFDGTGIYCPTDEDCYLRTFEKFAIHCLLLTGHDIKDGIEYWKLHDSDGTEWGNGGFIMMERHKCLIKSVVEFKL